MLSLGVLAVRDQRDWSPSFWRGFTPNRTQPGPGFDPRPTGLGLVSEPKGAGLGLWLTPGAGAPFCSREMPGWVHPAEPQPRALSTPTPSRKPSTLLKVPRNTGKAGGDADHNSGRRSSNLLDPAACAPLRPVPRIFRRLRAGGTRVPGLWVGLVIWDAGIEPQLGCERC